MKESIFTKFADAGIAGLDQVIGGGGSSKCGKKSKSKSKFKCGSKSKSKSKSKCKSKSKSKSKGCYSWC